MQSVKVFLDEYKRRVAKGNLDFVPAHKNKVSRRKYGLTIIDIENTIMQLDSSDLHSGPEKDRDRPNEELWIFKKELLEAKVVFYIKLKLRGSKIAVCLSFHEDEKKGG